MDYPEPQKKPGEDEILEVSLDDQEAQPERPNLSQDLIDITLDDLAAEDNPQENAYPEVTAVQQRAAIAAVMLQCVCSASGRGFEVAFEEQEPGVYYAMEVTATDKLAAADGKAGGGLSEIRGAFKMGPEFACPRCGSTMLSVCDACGTVLCGGGMTKGGACACPGCRTQLTLTGQAATSARGSGGGGKKKGLW
jgi:hypothetical protein